MKTASGKYLKIYARHHSVTIRQKNRIPDQNKLIIHPTNLDLYRAKTLMERHEYG
jgi:hypothetical protein